MFPEITRRNLDRIHKSHIRDVRLVVRGLQFEEADSCQKLKPRADFAALYKVPALLNCHSVGSGASVPTGNTDACKRADCASRREPATAGRCLSKVFCWYARDLPGPFSTPRHPQPSAVLPFCQNKVTIMGIMKGITLKLPNAMLRRLRQEARTTGRSVAALIRERLEAVPQGGSCSIYEITADLVGSVAGSRKPATNSRRRFARS